jgi:hypothetical protein
MPRTIYFLVAIIALILAACVGTSVTSTSTGSVAQSTAIPSQHVPTFAPAVTKSVVPTQTFTRCPSLTPEPTLPATLLLGEPPPSEASDYTLKPWNGDEIWNTIVAGQPEFPQNDNRPPYEAQSGWELVKLTLLREIVNRFPDSPHYPDAVALLISPESYGQLPIAVEGTLEPFRDALEAALNADTDVEISPEILDIIISKVLQQEDIHVIEVFPANNVLSDGAPGWILDVRIPGSYGAVFALAGEPGSYRLVSPRSNWHRFMWSDQRVFVYDLNANGIPEIAIWDSYWGTGMAHFCKEVFALYEWNDSDFVNLTPNIETHANTDVGYCLDFKIVDGPNGTQAITTGNLIDSGCSYDDYWNIGSLSNLRRYEWNGVYFSLVREEVLSLESSMPEGEPLNKCTLSWVNDAGAANDQAFQLLPTLLAENNTDLTTGFADQFGPAYLDYFRFKLGTWYAMRGQQSQALALLTQVRDNPANPQFDATAKLAKSFLRGYPDTSAYSGCVAASKVLDIYTFQGFDPLYLDEPAMREAWGFSEWQWGYEGCSTLFSGPSEREDPLNVCSLATAFRLSVQKQNFTSTVDLIQWLDSQQVPYTGLEEGDVNGDGRRDWLVLLGTGQNQSFHLWVLLNKSELVIPLWVSDVNRTTTNIPATWNTFIPDPPNDPLNVYQWTDGMIVFRVVSQDDWTGIDKIYQSIGYYDGESFLGFTVRPAVEGSSAKKINAEDLYVLLVGEESWEPDWYTIGWDTAINTLRVVSSPQLDQDQQVRAAESLLLEKGEPKGAIEILSQLLREETELIDQEAQEYDAPHQVRPYLQYLLGLAYEMNGDEQNAVIAYWNLWHDFPQHPLSYVVQQKLESNKP